MAAHDLPSPEDEPSRWVRRIARDLVWLGWGWRSAPRPVRVIVWSVTALVVGALAAIGHTLGLPTPAVDELIRTTTERAPAP